MVTTEFDNIRPYTDSEINDAMRRITDNPLFVNIANFLFANISIDMVKAKFRALNSVYDFQIEIMDYVIQTIVKLTSTGLSFSGFDILDTKQRYLFVANHRDIMLDSAILQIVLHANQHETSEITFGDNLMSSDFVIDIGKSNKMFRLVRGGTPREILVNSILTSKYIRYAINQKKQSVWIAQRNGRTKDGDDKTQQAVLKMFKISGCKEFAENFAELNIAPIVISYEYDPCDVQKTRELYISKRQTYVKALGEDLNSVLTGIKQSKGGIHLAASKPLSLAELQEIAKSPSTEQFQNLADIIDSRIHENYYLWKTNLIAHDVLHGNRFGHEYSSQEKENFMAYLDDKLSNIEGDKQELTEIFLGIYANPVVNFLKSGTPGKLPQDSMNIKQFQIKV